jgi:hypothetical protein
MPVPLPHRRPLVLPLLPAALAAASAPLARPLLPLLMLPPLLLLLLPSRCLRHPAGPVAPHQVQHLLAAP